MDVVLFKGGARRQSQPCSSPSSWIGSVFDCRKKYSKSVKTVRQDGEMYALLVPSIEIVINSIVSVLASQPRGK